MAEEERPQRPPRAARWRAVLAGGLVLGVGGAVTLASWNDTEAASGTFGSSVFALESQSGGSPSYASHPGPPYATLTFAATAMSPAVSHYAWLNVRTTPASTVGGEVRLTGVSSEGALAPALEYRAVRTASSHPASPCDASAFTASATYIAGSATTWAALSGTPTAVANPVGAAGAAIGFCFDVRIAPGASNSFQGTNATSTWTFTGMSG